MFKIWWGYLWENMTHCYFQAGNYHNHDSLPIPLSWCRCRARHRRNRNRRSRRILHSRRSPRLSIKRRDDETISVTVMPPSVGEIVSIRHRNVFPEFAHGETSSPNLLMSGWVRTRRFGSGAYVVYMENKDKDTSLERFKKDCRWAHAVTDVTWTRCEGCDERIEQLPWT